MKKKNPIASSQSKRAFFERMFLRIFPNSASATAKEMEREYTIRLTKRKGGFRAIVTGGPKNFATGGTTLADVLFAVQLWIRKFEARQK